MRLIKLYEEFINDHKNIHVICKEYNIRKYFINKDGSVDVDGSVNLWNRDIKTIPIRFNEVSGGFDCSHNKLESLEGCPVKVGGVFECRNNKLTTLNGCPREVNNNFYCNSNKLKSFEGCPYKLDGDFICVHNNLDSFYGLPDKILGELHCLGNPIHELFMLFQDYSKIELFNDLDIIREDRIIILDRLNDFLDMCDIKPVVSVKGYKCI